MRKELGHLEALWQRPDTSGFAELGASDALNFSSHAWTVSIDPATGAPRKSTEVAVPERASLGARLDNPALVAYIIYIYICRLALRLLSLSTSHWAQG